mgnify:CR=1 FL=1
MSAPAGISRFLVVMGDLCVQSIIVSAAVGKVNDTAHHIGNGSEGKAGGQPDGFLHESHQQRANADADIIGEHIGGVGHSALGTWSGAGDKGLKKRLQDAVAQTKEKSGGQQMYAGGEEKKTDHGENQYHQAGTDQNVVISPVDHVLSGQLGEQHAHHQADVEVGQIIHDALFLGQNGGIGDDRTVGNHQKHHVYHEWEGGTVDGFLDRKLLSFYFGIFHSAAGHADQSGYSNAEDGKEGRTAVHVALHLQPHKRSHRHTDGHGKGKTADTLGDLGDRQYITGQCHGGGAAHRVYHAHVEPHHNQQAKYREGKKGGEGQAEQGKKQQVYMVAIEVIQQIACHRSKQHRGHRHGGQDNAHLGPSDSDFLTVDGDNGNGGIKRRQYKQICDKEKDKPSVPDFLGWFHAAQTPLCYPKYSGKCHYI